MDGMFFSGRLSLSRRLLVLLLPALFCGSRANGAVGVHGRITFGSFAAIEKFSQFTDGTNRNDVATASARLYLKLTQMGSARWEVVADLRDKHDFFEKLDRQRKELVDANSFQVYQLSVRYPGKNIFGTAGRFSLSESGGVFVDGVEAGGSITSGLRGALFGGLNPRRIDQSFNQYNPESQTYGAYFTFEPKEQAWNKNLYITNAIVNETYKGNLDRNYYYHNSIFQWGPESRLLLLGYLDFVPRTYVQNANASVQQSMGPKVVGTIGYSAVDVIEYFRRQGVLERLEPSAYREGLLKFRVKMSDDISVTALGASGQREKDGYRRTEADLGFYFSHVFGRRWDAFLTAKSLRNFTSQDLRFRAGGGYFSRSWEVTLEGDGGSQKYDDGTLLHPMTAEFSVAHYLGDDLYGVLSFQEARDERVQITSAFFKVSYRFGNQGLAPIRDGSPPRGPL